MDFAETKCEVFQADDRTRLLAHLWLPTQVKAVLLGIHGGLAHAGDWVTPALYFKKKNIATYAPDLRWHGTYPQYNENGKVFFHINSYDEYVNDIHNFYLWVRTQHPRVPIFVISHSNGGLIALKYALTMAKESDIKGFIVSSPWLKNMVKAPKIVMALSKIIAAISPTFSVAPEPLTDVLTHDAEITARHHADEAAGLRGTKASARLAVESLKAQEWVLNNMRNWEKFPLYGIIAGQDRLADPAVSQQALSQIPEKLLTLTTYPQNFHENFNEVNRKVIFDGIWNWMQQYL